MDELPVLDHDLNEADTKAILDIFTSLKTAYSPSFDYDCSFDFRSFAAFENEHIAESGLFIKLVRPRGVFYLAFLQVTYALQNVRYSSGRGQEFQVWGTMELKKDFGHIMIKPETFIDKVHDWLNPIELDFEDDKVFSAKYFVTTDDKTKALLNLTSGIRQCIEQLSLKDFVLELFGRQLLIGNRKTIAGADATAIAKFLDDLLNHL